MRYRLTSWFAWAFARLSGRARPVAEAPPATASPDAPTAPADGAAAPVYVVTGSLWHGTRKWSVYNHTLGRPVATDLSRRQAETLCRLLSFADNRHPAARSETGDSLNHRTRL